MTRTMTTLGALCRRLRMAGAVLASSVALLGCNATMEVKDQTMQQMGSARQGPETAPYRSITGFSHALRCMDGLLMEYGVRDIATLVEELGDQTKKVNAGTRDMLITALSDMTRRSRAVRVVAFGKEASTAISFLAQAKREGAYEQVPPYDIKGSISQFDENVIRNQRDGGIGFQPFVNLGISRDAAASVIGLDLSMLTTADLTILPGVTSRNSVVILKQGRGMDADAAISKFGVNFTLNLSKSEGQSQAVRSLVELAAIELVGKLTKIPYWRCISPDVPANDEIKLEVSDWFHAMSAGRVEIIAWFQNQMRVRGLYTGPVDGQFNPAFDEAIAAYRAALGLSRRDLIDEAFFAAYLHADHAKVPRPTLAAVGTPGAAAAAAARPTDAARPSGTPAAPTAPLRLNMSTPRNQTRFAPGEPISFTLQTSRAAYVYCYLLDEKQQLMRLYPNRFARDALLPAGKALTLPAAMPFALTLSAPGARETLACFATARDIAAQLPGAAFGNDFEPLALRSLEQVRDAFVQTSGGDVAVGVLHVQAK